MGVYISTRGRLLIPAAAGRREGPPIRNGRLWHRKTCLRAICSREYRVRLQNCSIDVEPRLARSIGADVAPSRLLRSNMDLVSVSPVSIS